MLGRKQSLKGEPILSDYGPEETESGVGMDLVNKLWVRRLMRLCALVSLASVSSNTPKTFERYPPMQYITLCCDMVVMIFFTAEMLAKMYIRGMMVYLRDHWCQFDASMVFFLWTSVTLHVLQILTIVPP